jgi:tetratricopeptide (TPR) repeat protein
VTARSRQRAATSRARRTTAAAAAAALALALAGSATPARADGPGPAGPAATVARPRVEAGVRAYEAGDFAAASREFEAAYRIDPAPATLYAWAQSLRQGGRCSEAIDAYRRYLATNPDELQAAAATTGIALCEAAKPAPAAAPAPPAPPSAAAPADTPRRAWYHDPAGGALVIGGVAMAAIGATFFVLAERSIDRAEREPLRDRFVEQLDEATQRRRLGYAGAGLGAALVIGGIVRYATRGDGRAPIAVTATPGMVSIHGSY